MTARWPDPDRVIIGRHVASLDLRSMKSRTCYRQVLHGFQDVVERHEALGQEVLVAWLRASAVRRAPSTLLHRTRIVDRFLEHLVEIGAIERNPVAALRDECNIKQCMPIWRALASRDPEQALAELRQPWPFGSVLGEMMAEYVAMMRRRGYKYTSQPLLLLRFDRFLQLHPGPEAEPLSAMIDRWAATNVTRHHCGGMRKAQTRLCENPSSPQPVDTCAATRPETEEGGRQAMANTPYLLACGRATDARRRTHLSISTGAASTTEHVHDAAAGLLRRLAARRACPPRSR